jgi:AraC-like DNA-binding protein/mannose-6-phosphate isomerase-like protein (cupin superfamily)
MPVHHEPVELPPEQSFRILRWRDNIREVDVLLGPGKSTPLIGAGERWHAHPAMELTLVLSGAGTRFVGDDIAPVVPPELVLIGPDVPHYWRGLHGSSGYVIQFDFGPEHSFWRFPEAAPLTALWERSTRGLLYTGATRDRVSDIVRAMAGQNHIERLAALLRVFGLLAEAPANEQRQLCRKAFRLSAGDPHRQAIQQAIHLIADHCHEDLALMDIARAVHMSRATFCRHFRRLTGRTFVNFLNDVRLDHARRLLVEGALGISAVAFKSGFGNLSHFNRMFLRRLGQTPSAYRRDHRTA